MTQEVAPEIGDDQLKNLYERMSVTRNTLCVLSFLSWLYMPIILIRFFVYLNTGFIERGDDIATAMHPLAYQVLATPDMPVEFVEALFDDPVIQSWNGIWMFVSQFPSLPALLFWFYAFLVWCKNSGAFWIKSDYLVRIRLGTLLVVPLVQYAILCIWLRPRACDLNGQLSDLFTPHQRVQIAQGLGSLGLGQFVFLTDGFVWVFWALLWAPIYWGKHARFLVKRAEVKPKARNFDA